VQAKGDFQAKKHNQLSFAKGDVIQVYSDRGSCHTGRLVKSRINSFNECEKYPNAFTDAGVGKAKFLHPWARLGHKKSDKFYDIYFDADRPGFVTRNTHSSNRNIKFDINHAFKSFKKSNIFKGSPVLEGVFKFDKKVSEFNEFSRHGMLYIDCPPIIRPYEPLMQPSP